MQIGSHLKNFLLKLFKAIGLELIIILSFLVLSNNYLGRIDVTIKADGVGYYDYLPSVFIRGDFNRKDFAVSKYPEKYKLLNTRAYFIEYEDRFLDKYPIGTAILQSPFFLFTKWTTDAVSQEGNPGYQKPFHKAIFHAAIFYLFLSLYFFKRLLKLYGIKPLSIFFGQIFLVFATSVMHYSTADAGFSHIYSLFAITIFLWKLKSYFNSPSLRQFLVLCLLLGLIILLRQSNLIVLLVIPFIAGSWERLKTGVQFLFSSFKPLGFGILIIGAILFLQMLSWYFQTGHWVIYSYQGERFYFDEPHFFEMLFSYRKGLFVYAPILFVSAVSSLYYLFRKDYFSFLTFHLFLFSFTYVMSSWWTWIFGGSYGNRVYVEYYTFLLIPFLLVINRLKILFQVFVFTALFPLIYVAVIQTYQYKKFILHWMDMDEKSYWEVFLHTDKRFEGLLWKETPKDNLKVFKTYKLEDIRIEENRANILSICQLDKNVFTDSVQFIEIRFSNSFREDDQTWIDVTIRDTNQNTVFYHNEIPLIRFREQKLNHFHRGKCIMGIQKGLIQADSELELSFRSTNKTVLEKPEVILYLPIPN